MEKELQFSVMNSKNPFQSVWNWRMGQFLFCGGKEDSGVSFHIYLTQ